MLVSLVAASLAAVSLAPSPAFPQTDNLIEVLIKEGDPVPGLSAEWFVESTGSPRLGANGGWSSVVRAKTATFSRKNVLVGQLPGALDGPVVLLREDLPAGVDPLFRFALGALGGDRLGYLVWPVSGSTSLDRSAWVDDAMIARRAHPVPGRPGATWASIDGLWMGSSGEAVVLGYILDPSTPEILNQVLWSWQSGDVIVAQGDAVQGLPSTIDFFRYPIAISPDAQQWASEVGMADGRHAIVVNGAAVEFAPGAIAVDGELVPTSFTGGVSGLRWNGFSGVEINDRGHLAFTGVAEGGGVSMYIIVRNNRLFSIEPVDQYLIGMDERGGLLTSGFVLRYESSRILRPSPRVDVDRDGLPDSGYTSSSFSGSGSGLTRDLSELVGARTLFTQGGDILGAIFRARRARIDTTACNGFLASTGRPAELVATGSAIASDNDLTLHSFGLPTASRGYALLSRTFGIVQFPSGSQGQLCLQGAIGRLQTQLFLTGPEGRAAIPLNLTEIPQPVGVASAMAGDTWYAQAWFRDTLQGTPTSNFTSAAAIDFE